MQGPGGADPVDQRHEGNRDGKIFPMLAFIHHFNKSGNPNTDLETSARFALCTQGGCFWLIPQCLFHTPSHLYIPMTYFAPSRS